MLPMSMSKAALGIIISITCVVACSCVSCRNNIASTIDTIGYICGSGVNHELNTWTFAPAKFDWNLTNQPFVVSFSPLRARIHKVFIQFDKMGGGNPLQYKKLQDVVSNACFRISLFHCVGEKEELHKVMGTKQIRVWGVPGKGNRIESFRFELCEFSAAQFPWHYMDKIKIVVEMLRGGDCSAIPTDALGNGRIMVEEFYPLY